jgi:hypothetical protein
MKSKKQIELNWSKLLGFNQVKQAQGDVNSKAARALLGAKIGAKVGTKGPPV